MGNDVDRVPRKPGKAKPFCILGGVVMLLLATVGSEAWQAHVTPPIEQRIANLRELFADAMQVDCVGRDGNRAHQDQPACR